MRKIAKEKGLFNFLIRLFILGLVIYLIFVIIVKEFGMYIFDQEYASYKQTMDYVDGGNTDYNKVLIFGDSVAKAGIIPSLISDDTYNISMAGATPIEQYYIMQDYLENHEAPKTIVMMYFLGGYDSIDDFFWNRTIYFDCIKTEQFKEIVENGAFEKPEEAYAKFLQYKLCMPNKYYAAVKNSISLSDNRYSINKTVYQNDSNSKGQHYFGLAESFEPNNVSITEKLHFEPLDIIKLYMEKSIEQCIENGIQVIIEQHPINISTYVNMKEGYRAEYLEYMKSLQAKYPQIIVNCEYTIKDAGWLGDHSHLNQNGATLFTLELKQKYNQYF